MSVPSGVVMTTSACSFFLARLGEPCLVVVAVVVSYGLHLAVNGEPVGVYVEEAHEDAHHDAALVEVDVLVDFLDHYYASVCRRYHESRCVFFGEEADGAAEEVDDDAVDGAHDCGEAPERHLAVYEAPEQQCDCRNNDEAINECVGSFAVKAYFLQFLYLLNHCLVGGMCKLVVDNRLS